MSADLDRRARQLEKRMDDRLRELESAIERGVTSAEVRQMQGIAVAAGADMRGALGNYAIRGEVAAAADAYHDAVKAAVAEIIAHRAADGYETLPEPEDETWVSFPQPPERLSPAAEALMADVRRAIVYKLAGRPIGEIRTDTRWKVVIEGMASEAKFEKLSATNRYRSADKAILVFDRIASLLQSMMKADATASRYDGSSIPG